MSKSYIVFGDSHGPENLNAIKKAYEELNLDSAIFTGDLHYKLFSDFSQHRASKAEKLKQSFRTKSILRQEAKKGTISQKILEDILKDDSETDKIISSVAKSNEESFNKIFSNTPHIKVKGNWDRIEGETKDSDDITTLSGGGPFTSRGKIKGATCDNPETQEPLEEWQNKLREKPKNILVSHVAPTDEELTHEERDSKFIYQNIMHMKSQGIDTPKTYIHGHEHSPEVRFDKDLDAVILRPGNSGIKHGADVPTFMTADIDDDKKLLAATKYEIRSRIDGLTNITAVEKYSINYENKEVNKVSIQKDIIKEADIKRLKTNLSLDKSQDFIEKGFSFDFKDDMDAKEKSMLLEKNISIVGYASEKASEEVSRTIIESVMLHDPARTQKSDLKSLSKKIYEEFAKKAMKKFQADVSHIKDNTQKELIKDALVKAAYTTDKGEILFNLTYGSNNSEELMKKGKQLSSHVSKKVEDEYKRNLMEKLNDVDEKVYQEIIDYYLPLDVKRTSELSRQDAMNIWMNNIYEQGILTSKALEPYSYAFSKNKDYKANKKSGRELEEMFSDYKPKEEKEEETKKEPTPEEIEEMINSQLDNLENSIQKNMPTKDIDGKKYVSIDDLKENERKRLDKYAKQAA